MPILDFIRDRGGLYVPNRRIAERPRRCPRCFRWLPGSRYAPRWERRPATRNMAAGDGVVTSSGGVCIKSDGTEVIKNASDAASCACVTCTYCNGTPPATVDVTFASVTACAICFAQPLAYKVTGGDPNGTFTCTRRVGNNCVWDGTHTGMTVTRYNNGSGCTGSPIATITSGTITVSWTSATTITVEAGYVSSGDLFTATQTVGSGSDCNAFGSAVSNTNTCGAFNVVSASGGTATVV